MLIHLYRELALTGATFVGLRMVVLCRSVYGLVVQRIELAQFEVSLVFMPR